MKLEMENQEPSLKALEESSGLNQSKLKQALQKMEDMGLLKLVNQHIKLTSEGQQFCHSANPGPPPVGILPGRTNRPS